MALITGLLLLLVLTIVGIAAIKNTSLEYKMSANTANQSLARQASESGRMALTSVLPEHVHHRGWDGVDRASELDIKPLGSTDDVLYRGNSEPAPFDFEHDGLRLDAWFDLDMNGDGYRDDDAKDAHAALYVFRTATRADIGAGTAMIGGYMGLGRSMAGGGALVHFYVRSDGQAVLRGTNPDPPQVASTKEVLSNARVSTSADVKARVFN